MSLSFRNFDAYPKTSAEFQKRTAGGAAISVLSGAFIIFLLLSEFSLYRTVQSTDKLSVDLATDDKIRINIDFSFPHLPCSLLSLDVMDVSGEQHLDVDHNVFKLSLDEDGNPEGEAEKHELHGKEGGQKEELKDINGNIIDLKNAATKHLDDKYCGSCYGAKKADGTKCCQTCEEVRTAYRLAGWAFTSPAGIEQCVREGFVEEINKIGKGGCKMHGHIEVNKVAGNFHFAPGKSFQQAHMHVHDLMNFDISKFNVSHSVNQLSFGPEYPGMANPLDGRVQIVGDSEQTPSSGMFQYFVKIVPTNYHKVGGEVLESNQYSVTYHYRGLDQAAGRGLPGVFVFYDLSPIMVSFTESHPSFATFLTSVCAIVGGVFTVAGMVDKVVYRGTEALRKKMELGKLG
eukprot:TRINITY_DN44533_c0_g2_i1.p1 TRINITY_DN44533_c0_g2~~TRINITY_DN44533_c0_g2_i1.p1  ORF type:complete len:402 (-),score=93.15 TRINITY_DN44533_c0_g2_i1:174-1379(-)